jgi:NAD(P)-dependent dehydrogenase (short-subunit alcohol dehydrogenase family)
MAGVAAEYGGRGLKFFSVSPGFMNTRLTNSWSDHLKNQILSRGEAIADPADISRAILALSEAESTRGIGEDYSLTDSASVTLTQNSAGQKHIVRSK